MFRARTLSLALMSIGILVVGGLTASATPPDEVTICHKEGTPAEKTMTLPAPAAAGHMAGHGDTEGPCTDDFVIDADGIDSAQSGDPANREVVQGDALTDFPAASGNSGLDMFDQDGSQSWTDGDDLHAEGTGVCSTAIRDGDHDLGLDCKVLDVNGDLTDGEQVDCDVEVGAGFTFTPCPPVELTWHDVDMDGEWDSGEDIVFDTNTNGIFD